jgi:hypothetical protein
MSFHTSVPKVDMQKVPRFSLQRFTDALCYSITSQHLRRPREFCRAGWYPACGRIGNPPYIGCGQRPCYAE